MLRHPPQATTDRQGSKLIISKKLIWLKTKKLSNQFSHCFMSKHIFEGLWSFKILVNVKLKNPSTFFSQWTRLCAESRVENIWATKKLLSGIRYLLILYLKKNFFLCKYDFLFFSQKIVLSFFFVIIIFLYFFSPKIVLF